MGHHMSATRTPKFTEEKVLYFASKKEGMNVDRKKEQGTTLQSLIQRALNKSYIKRSSRKGHIDHYVITEQGTNRLEKYKAAYQARKNASDVMITKPNPNPDVVPAISTRNVKMASAPAATPGTLPAGSAAPADPNKLLSQVREMISEITAHGVICIDTAEPEYHALLDTGWFTAVARDDAGSYFTVSTAKPEYAQLAKSANQLDMTWAKLCQQFPIDQSVVELPISLPETLSQYYALGMGYLKQQVKLGNLTEAALAGVNDVYWDVCYDDKMPLSEAVNDILHAQSSVEYNSPAHHQYEREQLLTLANTLLSTATAAEQINFELFAQLASEKLGRKVHPGESEHVLRTIKAERDTQAFLACAQAFVTDCASLESRQQIRIFAEHASTELGRPVSFSESQHVLEYLRHGAAEDYTAYRQTVAPTPVAEQPEGYRQQHQQHAAMILQEAQRQDLFSQKPRR